ncbi:MAG: hypothetical protein N2C14_28150 [Planctomycetales bacterium]
MGRRIREFLDRLALLFDAVNREAEPWRWLPREDWLVYFSPLSRLGDEATPRNPDGPRLDQLSEELDQRRHDGHEQ